MTKAPAAKDPRRNVWLQLGFPDAEEHYLKAELVLRLDRAIKSLGLTQRVAAGGSAPLNPSCRNSGRKIHRGFARTAYALSDGAGLSYRDQNRRGRGEQGRGCHDQRCPPHGRVKRRHGRPPPMRPDAASGGCRTSTILLARALYVTAIGRRVVVVRAFVKKTQKTPRTEIELALRRAKEVA